MGREAGSGTGSDTGEGAMGAEAPPFKLMIFISIKMNGKETTYYAKCIQL